MKCFDGFSCDGEQADEDNGLKEWEMMHLVLTIILFIVVGLTIVRGVLGCLNRRASRRKMQEFKDNFGKRDEFIKEALPVSKWKEGDAEKECAICMEDFEPGVEVSRAISGRTKKDKEGCKHVFHPDCIKTWLMKHHECPTCRRTFLGSKESELFILYGSKPIEEIPSFPQTRSEFSILCLLTALFHPERIYLQEEDDGNLTNNRIHNRDGHSHDDDNDSTSGMNYAPSTTEQTFQERDEESNNNWNNSSTGINNFTGAFEATIQNLNVESNDNGSTFVPLEADNAGVEATFQGHDEESNDNANNSSSSINSCVGASEATVQYLNVESNDKGSPCIPLGMDKAEVEAGAGQAFHHFGITLSDSGLNPLEMSNDVVGRAELTIKEVDQESSNSEKYDSSRRTNDAAGTGEVAFQDSNVALSNSRCFYSREINDNADIDGMMIDIRENFSPIPINTVADGVTFEDKDVALSSGINDAVGTAETTPERIDVEYSYNEKYGNPSSSQICDVEDTEEMIIQNVDVE